MKIILANPRGFCAGVNMAIDSLDRALKLFGTPIYVYHEIVHNRPVVERFRKQGVIFVDGIDEIPEGATVLYSAHGVAPAIRAASAGRCRIRIRPRLLTMTTETNSIRRVARFSLIGSSDAVPASFAAQHPRTGHTRHFGLLGRQMVAPSSIIAWLKSPG